MDIGSFSKTLPNGVTVTHRTLGQWLVQQCQAGTADSLWIREIGFSLDGTTVLHWDRQRGQTGAALADGQFDSSHLWHDHISGYRDCENIDKSGLFRRFLAELSAGSWPPSLPPATNWVPGLSAGLPTVKNRDSSGFVRSAQAGLYAQGYGPVAGDPRRSIDGMFGPATDAAVRRFQTDKHLGVDGVVGAKETWPALLGVAALVQQGSTGTAVELVQALLCARGRWVAVDGVDGPATTTALRGFQQSVGLDDDGVAGPATFPRLIRG
jgi:hypothetical protein